MLLARHLIACGHRVLLLHRPGAWIADQPETEGTERFRTTFGRSPGELVRVARRLNRFDPDVLHTHMSSAHTYGMLARLLSRRPVVATAHSATPQLHWMLNNRVIATSPATERYHRLVNRVPRRAVRMIPGFIDTSRFPIAGADERAAAREMLGLSTGAFVVGCVGDICRRKRQIDLVRALPSLLSTTPDARLLLVGLQHRESFRQLAMTAQALGVWAHIHATGVRNDVQTLLAAMDVFALASSWESSPLAVLEAMSRGLPVVTSGAGMLTHFVRDGITGHVVRVGDVGAVSGHLAALAAEPERCRAMGHAAHAFVHSTYDVTILAPRVEAVLREAASAKNRPWLGFVAGLCGGGSG